MTSNINEDRHKVYNYLIPILAKNTMDSNAPSDKTVRWGHETHPADGFSHNYNRSKFFRKRMKYGYVKDSYDDIFLLFSFNYHGDLTLYEKEILGFLGGSKRLYKEFKSVISALSDNIIVIDTHDIEYIDISSNNYQTTMRVSRYQDEQV